MTLFYIHKLGCPKNDVDADYMAGLLLSKNYRQTYQPDEAEVIIINSCGFIQAAKEESIDAVLEMAQLKHNGRLRKLILTGCMAQRYAAELKSKMPELDGIIGLNAYNQIPSLLENHAESTSIAPVNPRLYPDYGYKRAVNPEEYYAYLKISDGCDNRCSYCAIPDIRGHYRSRAAGQIIDEARYLLDNGKKELILVSQEVTAYGRDLFGDQRLLTLLDSLSALSGNFWIRIMYLHPARLAPELIDYIIDNPRICSYFDIPLQHINNRLLAAMNRHITRAEIEEKLSYIRSRDMHAAIRTGFIVGFPGETDAEFDELCDFIENQEFDRMGAFAYSAEENTPAAEFPDQVAATEAAARLDALMEIQQQIAFDKNKASVGRSIEVLVETVDSNEGFALGRSRFDAPEIDQAVRFNSVDFVPGEFVPAIITGYEGYDLIAQRRQA